MYFKKSVPGGSVYIIRQCGQSQRFINSLKVIASQYGAFIEHFEIKNEGTYINVYVEMSVVGL